MRFIRDIQNIKPEDRGSVATIGCFDGVHLGHQHLIKKVVTEAQQLSAPSLLITFEPHPREFFTGASVPSRLTRLREKLIILKNLNLNNVLALHFDKKISQLSAEDFIQLILVKKLGIRALFVGEDFRFGKDRQGNIETLQQASKDYNFTVQMVPPFFSDHEVVSSSRIRQALANGKFSLANQLLGRPYAMCGRVIHGNKMGRALGCPTANIAVQRKAVPLTGIFIVKVHGLGKSALPGVASLGVRPAIDGSQMLLEVHIFDFSAEIYGRFLQVEFLAKIRDEQWFASLEELKQAMANDMEIARKFFQK